MHDNIADERPLPHQPEGPFFVDIRLVFDHKANLVTDLTLRNDLPLPLRFRARHSLYDFRSATGLLDSSVTCDLYPHGPAPHDPAEIHDLLSDVAFTHSPEIRDEAWDRIVLKVNGPHPTRY